MKFFRKYLVLLLSILGSIFSVMSVQAEGRCYDELLLEGDYAHLPHAEELLLKTAQILNKKALPLFSEDARGRIRKSRTLEKWSQIDIDEYLEDNPLSYGFFQGLCIKFVVADAGFSNFGNSSSGGDVPSIAEEAKEKNEMVLEGYRKKSASAAGGAALLGGVVFDGARNIRAWRNLTWPGVGKSVARNSMLGAAVGAATYFLPKIFSSSNEKTLSFWAPTLGDPWALDAEEAGMSLDTVDALSWTHDIEDSLSLRAFEFEPILIKNQFLFALRNHLNMIAERYPDLVRRCYRNTRRYRQCYIPLEIDQMVLLSEIDRLIIRPKREEPGSILLGWGEGWNFEIAGD